ncbi:DUF4232 domain-containing protein [Streptomyces albidoflavus]|uniref:DUF4232 domain-containing protein n=1 Tax=Streptomyces TaxID=1883 RepID=UPI001A59267F|nr:MULTISPECIES: DUF4232 domain-containing protein [unclassified Streptomyces]MBL0779737.1 DUF4232 domain-containing protein [Streptomyces albidoflavus]MBV1958828.1 DUF4232 domain-containing protein [Streptomyces sp. BV333]MCG5119752.1 DUF4232 domain-containing protein [Streptomyces sp. T7(2022)]MCK2142691.1 DUF4232 domain-containing protein [Streptomyces sp. WAC00276]MCQ9706430.1 DUF4232 domain-containing protein [Streptomyces sp. BSP1]
MRAQKITLATLALVTGLTLTACQGDDTAASADNAAPAASSPAGDDGVSGQETDKETAATTGGTASEEPEGSGGGQVNTGPCKTANLDISSTHGMGEGTLHIAFKNTGDACFLKGFPGVDLKADSGPGGINANRSDLAAPSVVLKTGESTRATLHYPANHSGGSGVDITLLDITPPNETHSKTVPTKINVPVSDHSTSDEVIIDPVGTGKQ